MCLCLQVVEPPPPSNVFVASSCRTSTFQCVCDLRGPNHEEADPRILIAYCLPLQHGFNNILVQSVDTDVSVLDVATVQDT